MKTDVTTPGSFAQSKALRPTQTPQKGVIAQPLEKIANSSTAPDYKVDLSSKAPTSAPVPTAPSTPSLPDMPDFSSSKPSVPEPKEVKLEKPKIEKTPDVDLKPEVKDGSVKKPAIFFIKGLDVFSSPSKSEGGYAGVGRMAEAVEGSRIYGWDQKSEIIKEIKKVHKDYPVILVGHSLGGDTAVEIADELDSLEQQFRKVDLLVTMDAIGFAHDIIPQNVKNHLNIFGEKTFLLNDGPHVARREENTTVRNILSPDDHTDIDDNKEVQYEIVNLIEKTLSKKA